MREKAALARGVALLGVKVPGPSYSMCGEINIYFHTFLLIRAREKTYFYFLLRVKVNVGPVIPS